MADDELDSLLARHKKEQKALTAQVTSLKKSVTKGEKARRKEVLAEVQRLEEELKERHRLELSQVQAGTGTSSGNEKPVEHNGAVATEEHIIPEIQDLKLDKPVAPPEKANGKPKLNRQKARLVVPRILI
jgi:hypothetical protein